MNTPTQIVATIGPASNDPEIIRSMLTAGMQVARFNFSHGDREKNVRVAQQVRSLAGERDMRVPIMQDLSGPRVQQGAVHSFDPNEEILTDKDRADLLSGKSFGFEYIAQSFVATAAHIQELRTLISDSGSTSKIIAKIERREAVENFDEILAAADAIMIARGDLGDAVPLEDIPFIQTELIRKTRAAQKPVITATQMLLTMKDNPVPTRAEVTDVAFAVISGTDATMLSEETASGKYPVESVAMMRTIATRAEREITISRNSL